MSKSQPPPTDPIRPADAEVAARFPCLLAPGASQVIRPWTDRLEAREADELADLLGLLHATSRRIAMAATRELPSEAEPLIGALTVRAWSLGVSATAARLGTLAREAAAGSGYARQVEQAARQQMKARYHEDPARIRRDGIDLLAGTLLDAAL